MKMLLLTLALSLLALPVVGFIGSAADKITTYHGAKPLDWHDLQVAKETMMWMVATIALVAVFLVTIVVVYRTSHTKTEVVKKVEDEANEVKQFNQGVVMRLLEAVSDQQKKDLFQTIAQGQAAIMKKD